MVGTTQGIGISPDSTVYIAAARELSNNGRFAAPDDTAGVIRPVIYSPPLYPAVLALGSISGRNVVSVARAVNVVLYAAIILFTAIIARQIVTSSTVALLAPFVTLFSADLLDVHVMAWTEPLFLFLMLLQSWFLMRFAATRSRWHLLGAAASAAACVLTRYVGVAFILSTVLCVLILVRGGPWHKLLGAASTGAVAALPFVLWLMRNLGCCQDLVGFSFGWYGIAPWDIIGLAGTFSQWFVPTSVGMPLRAATLCTLALGGAALLARGFSALRQATPTSSATQQRILTAGVLGTTIFCYLVVLLVSKAFLGIAFERRYLAPAFILTVLLTAVFVDEWLASGPVNGWRARASLAVVLVLLAGSTVRWLHVVREGATVGFGYASTAWRSSELIRLVREIETSKTVYTNSTDGLYATLGMVARTLPLKESDGGPKPPGSYSDQLREMAADLRTGRAVIVYTRLETPQADLPSESELTAALPLRAIVSTADGAVYAWRSD